MRKDLYLRLERISAWCGFVLLVGFVAAFSAGGILTPMSPTKSPADIVTFLHDHRTGILWCVVLMVLTVPFEYPYVIVTSLQMRRVEGGWGLLSMIQLTTGVVAPLGFFFPLAILAAAAYRPEIHSPDVLAAMSDTFWLMFVGNACIFVLQVWSIGYASFVDRRERPVFPRWYGWLSMVLGVLLVPGAFVFLFKTGPLAWNGILANTIPMLTYFVWKIATPVVLLRAVRSEEQELAGTEATAPVTV
ncbi:hypothetical protein [Streptomyces fuscichromogenes]|uniref:DUF4386 domain-containing protein n=1 Tax=Streptomyces fuscichromogenes TaxID=1324013 RepID=A0A918CXK6_9ACTN|nr:hypothetical protein [Streptomyces fuscichromogenes]GGN43923.1 hypothetical protein GCM10011578_094480 [Streptomyces fuscichromogenes]